MGSLVVANATGTGPSWHAAQRRDAPGGARGGTTSKRFLWRSDSAFRCLYSAAQSEWAPKIPKVFQKKSRKRGATSLPIVLIFSVNTRGINMAVAKTWHTRVCHTQPPPARTHPSASSPPSPPCSSLHHLAPSRSARLLTTCANAGAVLLLRG